jgi:hypothetical protein
MTQRPEASETGMGAASTEGAPDAVIGRPELRPVEQVKLRTPARLRVVHAGKCAWGYAMGNVWEIDTTGQIAPKLCRVAAEPLEDAQVFDRREGERVFTCSCPIPGNEVTFEIVQNHPKP